MAGGSCSPQVTPTPRCCSSCALGCGEGGCGACTVMVSRVDAETGRISHCAVNACLAPLYSVEGAAVVTVEGIGSTRGRLHPVQAALSSSHGSQCGFCTPGFVMSMYALLRSSSSAASSSASSSAAPAASASSASSSSLLPSEAEIEEAISGNLCRCTGYRPILEAFRTFARADAAAYAADTAASHAAASHGASRAASKVTLRDGLVDGQLGAALCPSTGLPCACRKFSAAQRNEAKCCKDGSCSNAKPCSKTSAAAPPALSKVEEAAAANGIEADLLGVSEPIFPPELLRRSQHPLPSCLGDCNYLLLHASASAAATVSSSSSKERSRAVWFRPITLRQLLALREAFPAAKVVAGNTEVGVEMRFKGLSPPAYIHVAAIPALSEISQSEHGITVGAAASLSALRQAMLAAVGGIPAHKTAVCAAVAEQLRWFAGVQIRNVATLAGNIVTASPISDLNPIFIAANATFHLARLAPRAADVAACADVDKAQQSSRPIEQRQVAARDFFKGYRKVDLREGEVLTAVFIPWTRPNEHIVAYKQAHRKDDDIALVNAALRVLLSPPTPDAPPTVIDCSLVFGGVAATTVSAHRTQQHLLGRPWTQETLQVALQVLQEEISVPENAPGGMPEFRGSLVLSFFFKFFLLVAHRVNAHTQQQLLPGKMGTGAEGGAGAEGEAGAEGGAGAEGEAGAEVEAEKSTLTTISTTANASSSSDAASVWPPPTYLSALDSLPRPYPCGMQAWEARPLAEGAATEGGGGKAAGEVVGEPAVHLAADLQVTGEAEYADDTPLPPSALHGALVLSTRPHARILSIDQSEAATCPGFLGMFGAKDVPGSNRFGAVEHDEEVFASESVHCVGQIIAVVVADTHDHARAAAKKVKVIYEDLPAVLTIQEALASGSFHKFPFSGGQTERNLLRVPNPPEKTDQENGSEENNIVKPSPADSASFQVLAARTGSSVSAADVESVLADVSQCPLVLEGEVAMGGQEHFYLEPNTCAVWPVDGGREVHMLCSTQAPTHHQKDVASALGIPMHRVVSRVKRLGGGFGGKETRSVLVAAAACVPAWRLNRAVRITLDRDDDMKVTGQRHPFYGKYKVGFTPSGRLVAVQVLLVSNAGCTLDLSAAVLERALFHCDSVYSALHMHARGRMPRTHLPSNTAFRGFGGPQGMMVMESAIDHVARTLGKSAEEIRFLNLQPEGYTLHFGQPLTHNPMHRIWTQLLRSSSFVSRRTDIDTYNSTSRWRKKGLAMIPTKFGISFTAKFLNQGGALVHVYTDGTVLVTHGGVEMGQGLHTKCAQIAAQTLGVPLSNVFISETSTDKVPNTSPTAASASSDIYGRAVLEACEEIKRRMEPIRQQYPAESFGQIADRCYRERINLSAQGFFATPNIGFDWATASGSPFAYFTFGAAVAEVVVDVLTGEWVAPRVDILMDVGRSLNPAIDIGQIEGAFVQGMGWSVIEESKWGDSAHPWVAPGSLFTCGPGTYKIPAASDIPTDFRVTLLADSPNPHAVLSSKAVGEPPFFLGSSVMWAIKDAIYAARKDAGHTGFFRLDSPATPERIRLACADQLTEPFCGPNVVPRLSV
ncbi:unnamed protein product [Closterium sp. NIES-54]